MSDKWGSDFKYMPPLSRREVIVDPPTASAIGGGGGSADQLAKMASGGDKSQLLMFLQAQSQMLSATSGGGSSGAGSSGGNSASVDIGASAGAIGRPGSSANNGGSHVEGGSSSSSGGDSGGTKVEDKSEKEAAAKAAENAKEAAAESAAAAQGDMKVNQISAVLATGGGKVTDLAGAEIMSKTIESIIGKPAQDGEKSALGQEVLKKTTTILGDMVGSLAGLKDIVDPEQAKPSITSITNTIGTLFDALFGMSGSSNDDLDSPVGGIESNDVGGENGESR